MPVQRDVLPLGWRLILAACIALVCSPSLAGDYLLQLEEVQAAKDTATATSQPDVVRFLETSVSLDRPFYTRTVVDGVQWLLRGVIEKELNGGMTIKYVFSDKELAADPAPLTHLEGRRRIEFGKRAVIGQSRRANSVGGTQYSLSLHPFVSRIGFRDVTSGFSVRLIDAAGQPVAGAEAGLYGPLGDSDWEMIVGPVVSDAQGIVRFSEGRASLPEMTFVAKYASRGLVSAAHLDRSNIAEYRATKPTTIAMRKELLRWKSPETAK